MKSKVTAQYSPKGPHLGYIVHQAVITRSKSWIKLIGEAFWGCRVGCVFGNSKRVVLISTVLIDVVLDSAVAIDAQVSKQISLMMGMVLSSTGDIG